MRAPDTMTKTERVRRLLAAGREAEALKLARGFRLGLTPTDRSKLERGRECLTRPAFYRELGHDPAACVEDAVGVLRELVAS